MVLVLSDALRASSLPLYGYPRETAPQLGVLAADGVLFERHLANYSGTPFSVSQMLTGRLMPPLLMDQSFALAPVRAIEDDLLIVPRALQEAGYRTGIVTSHPWFNRRARILRFFDERAVVKPSPGQAYARFEDLVPAAAEFLEHAGEPFLLYVHSMDTHAPFGFHEGFEGFRDAPGWPAVYNLYDSEILYTDFWFGRLMDLLRRREVLDRTVVVFTSDHGEELGEMGPEPWNRGHGHTVRRVQLHVPLVIRLPEGRSGGRRIAVPTSHLDLAPTLLGLARSGTSLEGYRLDGRDLSSWALGKSPAENRSYTNYAYSWRYWGLFREDWELHYDQWWDEYDLYRTVTDRFNYPRSVPEENPSLEASLAEELGRVYEEGTREYTQGLPPSHELLGSIPIGVPTTLVSSDGPPPTFERDPLDGRWLLDTVVRLEADPRERPGAVTLATAWAPGEYRVWVRLGRDARGRAFRNRFRLRVSGGEPIVFEGSQASEDGLLDAGIHRIGRVLVVEISEPEGGVVITGFALERLGGDAAAADDDGFSEELERRLRALGYVD